MNSKKLASVISGVWRIGLFQSWFKG